MSRQLIVKVQQSLHPRGSVMTYNEDRSIFYHGKLTAGIRKMLRGRPKGYFYARMRGTLLELNGDAPEQDW